WIPRSSQKSGCSRSREHPFFAAHLMQPAHGELAPFADDETLIAEARELAEGLLHQFGIDMPG
ncbi:hypothetical protein AB0K24_51180, partial [Streptomyces mirabilis]|uniref:hypothetical protein n=1 Tax=Streptomyces mirabilis TaxID=68239 RepID=UPI00342FABCF